MYGLEWSNGLWQGWIPRYFQNFNCKPKLLIKLRYKLLYHKMDNNLQAVTNINESVMHASIDISLTSLNPITYICFIMYITCISRITERGFHRIVSNWSCAGSVIELFTFRTLSRFISQHHTSMTNFWERLFNYTILWPDFNSPSVEALNEITGLRNEWRSLIFGDAWK